MQSNSFYDSAKILPSWAKGIFIGVIFSVLAGIFNIFSNVCWTSDCQYARYFSLVPILFGKDIYLGNIVLIDFVIYAVLGGIIGLIYSKTKRKKK